MDFAVFTAEASDPLIIIGEDVGRCVGECDRARMRSFLRPWSHACDAPWRALLSWTPPESRSARTATMSRPCANRRRGNQCRPGCRLRMWRIAVPRPASL